MSRRYFALALALLANCAGDASTEVGPSRSPSESPEPSELAIPKQCDLPADWERDPPLVLDEGECITRVIDHYIFPDAGPTLDLVTSETFCCY